MSIGFVMSGPDNDSYMLRGPGSPPVCGSCGLLSGRAWVDPGFELRDRRFDVSYTYDGYLIVSQRFKDVADGVGTRFIGLPSISGFYALVVENVLPFDTVRRKTRFEQRATSAGGTSWWSAPPQRFSRSTESCLISCSARTSSSGRATSNTRSSSRGRPWQTA